jgi:hypothetical protein
MRSILDAVDRAASDFAGHPFLVSLEYAASLDRMKRFASGLTFWVLAFQDILRIHEELATDPLVRDLAATLRQNDRGDDLRFLHDMHLLGTELDLHAIFARDQASVRDGTYALVAELYRAESDYARLALLLTLSACDKVFFAKVGRYVERIGHADSLRWLAGAQKPPGESEALWDLELQADLATVILPTRTREEALRVVERSARALSRIMDHLARLARRPRLGSGIGFGAHAVPLRANPRYHMGAATAPDSVLVLRRRDPLPRT